MPNKILLWTLLFYNKSYPSLSLIATSIRNHPLVQMHRMRRNQNRSLKRFFSSAASTTSTSFLSCAGLPEDSDGTTENLLGQIQGQTLVSLEHSIHIFKSMMEHPNPSIQFIDASWWHKGVPDAGRRFFQQGPRIPHSIYLDIDDFCLPSEFNPKNLPHMLPTSNQFAAVMDHYQISNKDHIFIYARKGVFFTPRIWFLFRAFGHDPSKIHLIQGSLEEWIEKGGPVEEGYREVSRLREIMEMTQKISKEKETKEQQPGKDACDHNYSALKSPNHVCDLNFMLNVVEINASTTSSDETAIIIDSRGISFYTSGHIPGSIHIPYDRFTTKEDSLRWKSIEELRNVFQSVGIDPLTEQRIIATCGSGISVCHTLLALELCGRDLKNDFMYDASWAEWGSETHTPKVKGMTFTCDIIS